MSSRRADHKATEVRTIKDFGGFVEAMRNDLNDPNVTWENETLDAFLEALSAWCHDVGGGPREDADLDWRPFAEDLLAATDYE